MGAGHSLRLFLNRCRCKLVAGPRYQNQKARRLHRLVSPPVIKFVPLSHTTDARMIFWFFYQIGELS